jgi:hypothetical protein
MTESWPDKITEEWRPSVAFRTILSRHDSVCFVPLLCGESSQAASKWKDCSTEDARQLVAHAYSNQEPLLIDDLPNLREC